jgi:hypothetical protein
MKELPQPACSAICRNAMNETCIERCTPLRDCSSFEVRDISLPDMPRYPDTSNLTWKERFVIQEAYTLKITEYLQGSKNEQSIPRVNYGPRNGKNTKNMQGTRIQISPGEENTIYQIREGDSDQEV